MAIGDSLFGDTEFFTPEMRAAGVRLIPSGATPPIHGGRVRKVNNELLGGVGGAGVPEPPPKFYPGTGSHRIPALEMLLGIDLSETDVGTGIPQLDPEDVLGTSAGTDAAKAKPGEPVANLIGEISKIPVAPSERASPFGPPVELTVPERQQIMAEGIKEKGNFFSSLGDVLGNPAFIKGLAALGGQIDPRGLGPAGEFAITTAETIAADKFRQDLDALEEGQDASSIPTPGLSTEGKERILKERELSELRRSQEARLQDQLEISKSVEQRMQELHADKMKELQNRVAAGEITLEQAKLDAELSNVLRAAKPKNASDILEAGAAFLGLEIPQGVNLDNIPIEHAYDLIQQAAALTRSKIAKQPIPKASQAKTKLTPEQKTAEIKRLLRRRTFLQAVDEPTAGERKEMRDIEDALFGFGIATKLPTPGTGGGTEDATAAEKALRKKQLGIK